MGQIHIFYVKAVEAGVPVEDYYYGGFMRVGNRRVPGDSGAPWIVKSEEDV